MPSRCAIFATSVSADDRAEDSRGSKCRLSEEMRCFRHSPYRGADERLLRCFGHQRELSESTSRIYKPYKNFGHRRNSITLSSRLDNLHNRSSSCSSTTLTTTHQNPPSNTQTLVNNVVLSIPEGRDQADSGRMLVSPGRSSDPLIILIDFGD
jgi:hypothetical protein